MTNPTTINPSFKVIADHLRSSSFLIADGVMPSNEGRGYVLRRIMRRAMRHAHKLGAGEPLMYKLVPALIKEMGETYPELVAAKETIIDILKTEEERFRTTLSRGMEILEEELSKVKKGEKFSGAIAFKLYDTYGFPLDLTQDILREKTIEVDVENFNSEMEQQKKRGRENWVGSGEKKEDDSFFELKEKFGETKFVGYENTRAKAKILKIIHSSSGKIESIVLDQTPFYATSGGQKGDDGVLILASEIADDGLIDYSKISNRIEISSTEKIGGIFSHRVSSDDAVKGNLKEGDEVIAFVNNRSRQFRAINHSATHLLHLALKQILGNQITQKGSNVDSHYFTFDFNYNKAVTVEELDQIEDLVNFYIRQNSQITTEILPLDEARNKGAMALFGEKYDQVVRVLEMGQSIELCGGTHAKATGNIGAFKIISEKGIAAGIRRIEAKTGFFALEHFRLQERRLQNLLDALKIKPQFGDVATPQSQFDSAKKGFDDLCYFKEEQNRNLVASKDEVESLKNLAEEFYKLGEAKMAEVKALQKEIEKLKKEKLSANTNFKAEKFGEINLVSHFFDGVNAKELRDLTTQTKNQKEYQQNSVILFFGFAEEKLSSVLAVSQNLAEKFPANQIINKIAEKIGGKNGGGKPDLAMCGGVDKNGVEEAVEVLKTIIKNA
ncbi:MAG: alanyl-tRNA synthetase [Rickettsiaceae bacterium]|jgi:alanyl-tRNA synthetase|nr:alanyl-tRNA synthetase [Rickettsiaceae bacterium]